MAEGADQAAERPGGRLTIGALADLVGRGTIDTVVVEMIDLQGQLIGKRVTGSFFVDSVTREGMHACSYLWGMDVDNTPLPGFALTGWSTGYQDFHAVPDLRTLRWVPWLPATAIVLCDLETTDGEPVEEYPRQVLRRQVEKLAAHGMHAKMASELEFYTFQDSYRQAAAQGYRDLHPTGHYIEDYHILQGSKVEGLLRAIRTGMDAAGIPVESSKGEWGHGQGEINLRYADPIEMADRHVLYKNGAKEIAIAQGMSLTFMAKWTAEQAGSSCHVHTSLWATDGDRALFHQPEAAAPGMSALCQQFLAGQLQLSRELSVFTAPGVNSYKRYREGSFAPVRLVWGYDNRTCGLRVVGHQASLRIEARHPGADVNPYLALASILAAGRYGIERGLALPPMFSGDAYAGSEQTRVPHNLEEAIGLLAASTAARELLGTRVVEHYLHLARMEQETFDTTVTDWERQRNFERI